MTTELRRHRQGYWKRFGGAAAAALTIYVLFAEYGPDPNDMRKWLLHTGAEGELRVMPEVHIIQDDDPVTQKQMQTMAGATQGIDAKVVERKPVEQPMVDPLPMPPRRGTPTPVDSVDPNAFQGQLGAQDPRDQVEMRRATQQSSDFMVVKLVYPRYPAHVPASMRQRKVVVEVGVYVEVDGKVGGAYISRSGSKPFDEEVLRAVRQWEYRYIGPEGQAQPMWDQLRWTFPPVAPASPSGGTEGDAPE